MSRKMSRATVVRTNSRNRVVMSMLYTCKGREETGETQVQRGVRWGKGRGQVFELRRGRYEGQMTKKVKK